ncbi:MAG: DUF3592 domain-containing protein [Verrucomicrobiaceae bacterium]|nr:DUF3592 domain-containing protein [Verrucomicrobiaceae bacterium]
MSSTNASTWTPKRITAAFRLAALGISLIGLLWTGSTLWFVLTAEKADALVVGWETSTSSSRGRDGFTEHSTTYRAVVEFMARNGGKQRATSPRALNHRKWPEGASVQVYHDPQSPSSILIDDAGLLWFGPGIIAGMGVLGVGLTTLILHLLDRAACRRKQEVDHIVSRHISKKK